MFCSENPKAISLRISLNPASIFAFTRPILVFRRFSTISMSFRTMLTSFLSISTSFLNRFRPSLVASYSVLVGGMCAIRVLVVSVPRVSSSWLVNCILSNSIFDANTIIFYLP